ncbi:hypothetical protein Tco_0157692 [Tanacetum coccineum]
MVGGNGGNQFRQYDGQNVGNQNGYNAVQNAKNQNANQNRNGNGNVVAARAEVRLRRTDVAYLQTQLLIAQKEKAWIQLQAEEFDLMAAAGDLDEIQEVNANCILMANLKQASTSSTQIDKASVYDSDGSTEVHHYDNCYNNDIFNMFTQEEQYSEILDTITKPHMIQQNNSNVISVESCVEDNGGIVEQHRATVEKTIAYFESLYNNLAIEVEKINSVNRKMKETNAELTTELAIYKNQEKCFEINQEKYDKLERFYQNVSKSVSKSISIPNEEFSDDTSPSVARNFLNEFLKEATKFVRDFKSLTKEADESFAKHKALEHEIERLLRAVASQDIMSIVQSNSVVDTSNLQTELDHMKEKLETCIIKKEKEYAVLWNNWYKKCEKCKYDKISYDKAYNDMQNQIERLQAQLGDLKESQVLNYAKENAHLKTTYNNLFDSINVTCAQTKIITDSLQEKLNDTIYENAKLRAWLFDNVSKQKDTNKGTSANTKFTNQSNSRTKLHSVTPLLKTQVPLKVVETNDLSNPVTSNSAPTTKEPKFVKNDKVIAPGMFRINPSMTSREDKFVPINQARASVRTNPITVSQPHVITKKDVNSDSNSLSSTGVDITAKTRRPQL